MRKLEFPSFNVADIFPDLIFGIQKKKMIDNKNRAYKELFEECQERIYLFEQFYFSLASSGNLGILSEQLCGISQHVGDEEMKYLYNDRLRKAYKDSFYKWLKTNEGNNFHKCSYCEKGDVSELDHLLPRSKFPIFAVTPVNLIPSCHECNNNKSDNSKLNINPYFEDTTKYIWLKCQIVKQYGDYTVRYSLDFTDVVFNSDVKERIKNTYCFGNNSILSRYSIWGINKITDKLELWKSILLSYGKFRLLEMLEREIQSIKTCSDNSYELALYRGMIDYITKHDGL